MFLRLVDARDITALVRREDAMDVLLEDLEITRHRMEWRPKLVTEASEKLGLDSVRCFRFLARGLLSFEGHLELASALGHPRVQRPIQRVHAFLGRAPDTPVPEEPADGGLSDAR